MVDDESARGWKKRRKAIKKFISKPVAAVVVTTLAITTVAFGAVCIASLPAALPAVPWTCGAAYVSFQATGCAYNYFYNNSNFKNCWLGAGQDNPEPSL